MKLKYLWTIVCALVFSGAAFSVNAATVTSLQLKDVGSNTANAPGNYSPVLDGVAGAFIDYNPLSIQKTIHEN